MKKCIGASIIAILLIALLCIVLSCQQPPITPNSELEKDKVQAVIDNYLRAQETKDMQLFSEVFAHDEDMVIIGTDTAEYLTGWQQVQMTFSQIFDSMDQIDIQVSDQSIKISQSGDVAWYSDIEDFSFVSQGQTSNFNGWRVTGVLEKRSGNWLIVQVHTSVPVSGQVIEY
jgi:uncharacterized protein (TIGR02246 family)